mmetsp:Transcript_21245/g.46296  ORF Transcript_21245/g.46296 Transcript_21245/m.46296 type:complete len:229 (-) Transcript_21245:413-1099(-)
MDESGGSASIAGALGLSVEQCALSVELNGLQDELNGDDVVRASVGASEIALLREPRIVAEEVELDRLERGLWLLFEEAGDSNDGRKAPERMEACWIAVEACPCATYGDGDRGRRGSASMAGERTMTFCLMFLLLGVRPLPRLVLRGLLQLLCVSIALSPCGRGVSTEALLCSVHGCALSRSCAIRWLVAKRAPRMAELSKLIEMRLGTTRLIVSTVSRREKPCSSRKA